MSKDHQLTQFILDDFQQEIIDTIQIIFKLFNKNNIFSLFSKVVANKQKGFYLYGKVGCGKTMIMNKFLKNLKVNYYIWHFQDLMQTLHKIMHENKNVQSKFEIISKYTQKLRSKYFVIGIDEFEIKDLTDVMILDSFIKEAIKNKIFLFFTSNTKPDDLYKNGPQRKNCLSFIDFLNQNFKVMKLNSGIDYREQSLVSLNQRIIHPNTKDNNNILNQVIINISQGKLTSKKIISFGREIIFNQTFKNILITNFNEICEQNFSYSDYVTITQNFDTVFIFDIPLLAADSLDITTRFINLIDNIYFCKLLLFASLADDITKIYAKGTKTIEFTRTISRIHEMNSDNYFNITKNNLLTR